MTAPRSSPVSVFVLCLVLGLASVAAPALVGVASDPTGSVGTADRRSGLVPPPTGPGPPGDPPCTTGDPPAAADPLCARGQTPPPPDGPPPPLVGAPSPPVAGVPGQERFGWPLTPPHRVVRPFDAPSSPYGPGHRGVDLAAPAGAPVLASAAGVVVFAGPVAGRGVVSVDHPNGLRTTYEPIVPAVKTGARVVAGTVLGHLRPGHAGCPGACLHWGVRRGEEYLDPLSLVSTGRVRLLPWEEAG